VLNSFSSGIFVLKGSGDGTSDGRLDIVAEEPLALVIHVFAQLDDATFADRAYPGGGTGGIVVADLTGDAKNDVAWVESANQPGSSVVVLAQRAQGGTLAPGVVYPSYDVPGAPGRR